LISKSKRGLILILSSPSGAGKTTLAKKFKIAIIILRYRYLTQPELQDPMK